MRHGFITMNTKLMMSTMENGIGFVCLVGFAVIVVNP